MSAELNEKCQKNLSKYPQMTGSFGGSQPPLSGVVTASPVYYCWDT